MKKILIILALILLAIATYWAWLKFSPTKTVDGFYLIPQDAVMVVESEDPVNNWQTFSNSSFWTELKTFPPFAEITQYANLLDDVIKENSTVFSLLGKRHLLISTHMTKTNDYDFVYYADISDASKSSLLKTSMVSLISKFDYKHSSRDYMNQEIHEFLDPKTRDVLSLMFINNYMVLSYNKGLIDKVVLSSQTPENQFGKANRFDEVNQLTSARGVFRLFLNYETFHKYLGVYMDDESDVKELFSSLFFTGFDCEIDNDKLTADGYSLVNDSLSSYLQALAISGKYEQNSENIFSDKTSFYLSMGFTDFNTFYKNLETIWKKDENSYNEMTKNIKKVEKLLGIKLQENLFDWMGSEIGIAQYETDKLIGNKVNSVMAIHANDIKNAQKQMADIEKQIKKRTPLKFKELDYKGYKIQYLEIKGLFKALLGKLFKSFDKPYITYIDNYVVMSDDPKTLLMTIDDFINKKTLSTVGDYNKFKSKYSEQNSVFAYISANKHFQNFKGLLEAESWKSSQENQKYIRCFPHIGLGLSGEGDRMRTVFSSQLIPFDVKNELSSEIDSTSENDTLSYMELFLIKHFQHNTDFTYYDNGLVNTATEIDGSIPHGVFIEYYDNGIIKIKGRYKKGLKEGTWKYYDTTGKEEKKEKYVAGEIKQNKTGFLNNLIDKIF